MPWIIISVVSRAQLTTSRPAPTFARTKCGPARWEGTPGRKQRADWPAPHVTAPDSARARTAERARRHVRCWRPPSAPSAVRSDTSPRPARRDSAAPACVGSVERCPRCSRRCIDLGQTIRRQLYELILITLQHSFLRFPSPNKHNVVTIYIYNLVFSSFSKRGNSLLYCVSHTRTV